MRNGDSLSGERLPPHAIDLEAGILACCLLDPAASMPMVQERAGADQIFYDLRHQTIWDAMTGLWAEGRVVEVLNLKQRLEDSGKLEQVGGLAYLAGLPDMVPAAACLGDYLQTVFEKFLARKQIAAATQIIQEVYQTNQCSELTIERARRFQEEIEARSRQGKMQPKFLKAAGEFEDGFAAQFFGGGSEMPGAHLPINFDFKIRPQETTLVTGDDGTGKSTVLSYFALHLMAQGARVCVASMEMPPPVSLWIMAAQLLGTKTLPESTEGYKRAASALAWLNARCWFYDFLGIADWRDLLDTFRYAARNMGATIFVIDSVMRIGIADDDYAVQGIVSAAFAQFAMEHKAHLFHVIHENKSDAKGKGRIRGSKLWSANAHNVVRVERNVTKGEKIADAEFRITNETNAGAPSEQILVEAKKDLNTARVMWDTHFVLQKQRWPGSRQNASKYVWFNRDNFQFREHPADEPVDWLHKWTKKEKELL